MNVMVIKQRLKQMERSQAWVGRRVNRTPACVSYWFNNKVTPELSMIQRIADILGIGLDTIIERESK